MVGRLEMQRRRHGERTFERGRPMGKIFFRGRYMFVKWGMERGSVDGRNVFEWMLFSSVARRGAGMYGGWMCSGALDEYWGVVDLGPGGRRHKLVSSLEDFWGLVDGGLPSGLSEAVYSVSIAGQGGFARGGLFVEWCKCIRSQCIGLRVYKPGLTLTLAVRRAVKEEEDEGLIHRESKSLGCRFGDASDAGRIKWQMCLCRILEPRS